MLFPPEYRARCLFPGCSWHVGTIKNNHTPDPATYRDQLATQHENRHYDHTVERSNHA